MSVIGIIAEYNPFHNGHLYLLQKSKELTGANFSIAVMSGNFLQRGEPAFWNKWERTKMALLSGIDLVIELPFVFATQDAGGFAEAGIRLLNSLGIVDYIAFGCENNNLELFLRLAELINNNHFLIKDIEKEEIKKGFNFPNIREKIITSLFINQYRDCTKYSLEEIKSVLNNPNNILALEYVISLQKTNSSIKALPIKRIGSDFNQNKLEGKFSSATAIRETIKEYYSNLQNKLLLEKTKDAVPVSTYSSIINQLKNDINPILYSDFEQMIFSKLRSISIDDLKKINGIDEGLENKIKKASLTTTDLEGLISTIKSKRYTRTRIQRMIIHCLLNLTKQEVKSFSNFGPLYFRILGLSNKGQDILRKAKATASLPFIQKLKTFYQHNKKIDNRKVLKMIDYDIKATDQYVLAYKHNYLKIGSQDFTSKIKNIYLT